MHALRSHATALAVFALLTAAATYPQVLSLTTRIADHPDPYFSIWRLGWVAHQLVTDPRHLFDANIFYPEPNTFAYSDAMLLPASVLAPLFWLRVNPVLIYNVALLGALTLSGYTMFLLARHLTGSRAGAYAAGTIYALAPYRMQQYIHLEMEMVFWIPSAILALHLVAVRARVRDGLVFGAATAAQALSGIYGAMCLLATFLALGPLVWIAGRRPPIRRMISAVAISAITALVLVAPYIGPYRAAHAIAGPRGQSEIRHYQAELTNYLASPPGSRIYGWTANRFGAEELTLFPGVLAVALAVVGLVTARDRMSYVYATIALLAFDASRGFDGFSYPLLYQFVTPFQALRVPARFDLFVNLSLGVLAAFGVRWLSARLRESWRPAVTPAVLAVMLIEYASSPALALVERPSLADRWLATQPVGVIVEMPLPTQERMWPNHESRFMFDGMAHWQPMLNGYSGFFPPSYLDLVPVMETFPDDRSIAYLRSRSVDYILVRPTYYEADQWTALQLKLEATPGLTLIAGLPAPGNEQIYRLTR